MTAGTPSSLAGKRAIVTGAGSGIGAAVVGRLAAGGARVIAVDRDEARLCDLYQRQTQVETVVGDVRDDEIASLPLRTPEADVLVNAAGVLRRAPILDHTMGDWTDTMDINVRAAFRLSRNFASRRVSLGRGGSIVNVCSIESFTAAPAHAAYTVSKTALAMLTKAMALELASHGVRVNAIAPGVTETRMNEDLRADQDRSDRLLASVPMRRFATPEEQAAAVAFLLSDDASYITGAILAVDGGWLTA